MANSNDAVVAEGLQKHFGETQALRGIDLNVPKGTILGMLGPNGAGKTTAVRILSTLLKSDGGHAEVAGFDVARHPDEVRRRIGLSGQYAALDEMLTGKENLEMIGRLYHLPKVHVRRRAADLLERFNLVDAGNRTVKTYSGGMRRRLDLAGALVAEPPVLFLDEPTTGLDPRSRNGMWELIRELVANGTTLLLTTQMLDEADSLADQITVIDEGRVIARGTSEQLKEQVGGAHLNVVLTSEYDATSAAQILGRIGSGNVQIEDDRRKLSVPVGSVPGLMSFVIRELDSVNIQVDDIALTRPTLDDVFLTLTGHTADEMGTARPAEQAKVEREIGVGAA
ncbi:MAG TPA: ATP-binding cassette domain-containing protein [Nitrolancea sp.]|nr:ATP-binding cassette domain-containing protein [Nitrolancea sp.]